MAAKARTKTARLLERNPNCLGLGQRVGFPSHFGRIAAYNTVTINRRTNDAVAIARTSALAKYSDLPSPVVCSSFIDGAILSSPANHGSTNASVELTERRI